MTTKRYKRNTFANLVGREIALTNELDLAVILDTDIAKSMIPESLHPMLVYVTKDYKYVCGILSNNDLKLKFIPWSYNMCEVLYGDKCPKIGIEKEYEE